MWKLRRFLKDYRKQVIIGPIFKWMEAVLELIVPLVMAKIIDVGVKNADKGYVFRMGGLLLLIAAVSLGCALVCQYSASIASQGVGTNLRREMFDRINRFSHAELDRFGTHSLITRLTNDVNQLQVAVAMLIRLVVRAPFLAIGAVVMAFTIDVKLSLIFLVVFPLIVGVLYFVMNRSIPFFRVMQKKLDKISLITRENLEGARVIRAFSKQDAELSKIRNLIFSLYDYFMEHPEKMPDEHIEMLYLYGPEEVVKDYIAGMTDRYAISMYKSIFVPTGWRLNYDLNT